MISLRGGGGLCQTQQSCETQQFKTAKEIQSNQENKNQNKILGQQQKQQILNITQNENQIIPLDLQKRDQQFQKLQSNKNIDRIFDITINIINQGIFLLSKEKKAISWTKDGYITIWCMFKGVIINQFQLNIKNIDFIETYQDHIIIVVSGSQIIKFNPQNGKQIYVNSKKPLLQYSINDQFLLCMDEAFKLKVYRLKDLKLIKFSKHNQNCQFKQIFLIKQSSLICLYSQQEQLLVYWNFTQFYQDYKILLSMNSIAGIKDQLFQKISFSEDYQKLMLQNEYNILIFDISQKKEIINLDFQSKIMKLWISSQYLAIYTEKELFIKTLDKYNNYIKPQSMENYELTDLTFSKFIQDRLILLTSKQIIRIWNLQNDLQKINQQSSSQIDQIEYINDQELVLKINQTLFICDLKTGQIKYQINYKFDKFYVCKSGKYIIFLRHYQQELEYFNIITNKKEFDLSVYSAYDYNYPQKTINLIQSQQKNIIGVYKKIIKLDIDKMTVFMLEDNLRHIQAKYDVMAFFGVFSNNCRFFIYLQAPVRCEHCWYTRQLCQNPSLVKLLKINSHQYSQVEFQFMEKIKIENYDSLIQILLSGCDFYLVGLKSYNLIFWELSQLENYLKFDNQNPQYLIIFPKIISIQENPGPSRFSGISGIYASRYYLFISFFEKEIQILDISNLSSRIKLQSQIKQLIIQSNEDNFVILRQDNKLEVWNKFLYQERVNNIYQNYNEYKFKKKYIQAIRRQQ